jgi:hypothetical protein
MFDLVEWRKGAHNEPMRKPLTLLAFALAVLMVPPLGAQESESAPAGVSAAFVEVQGLGSMHVQVASRRLSIVFVDAEGKPVAPPVQRVVAHVRVVGGKSADLHLMMTTGDDGLYMTNPRVLPAPQRYNVRLVLYPGTGEEGAISLPEIQLEGGH